MGFNVSCMYQYSVLLKIARRIEGLTKIYVNRPSMMLDLHGANEDEGNNLDTEPELNVNDENVRNMKYDLYDAMKVLGDQVLHWYALAENGGSIEELRERTQTEFESLYSKAATVGWSYTIFETEMWINFHIADDFHIADAADSRMLSKQCLKLWDAWVASLGAEITRLHIETESVTLHDLTEGMNHLVEVLIGCDFEVGVFADIETILEKTQNHFERLYRMAWIMGWSNDRFKSELLSLFSILRADSVASHLMFCDMLWDSWIDNGSIIDRLDQSEDPDSADMRNNFDVGLINLSCLVKDLQDQGVDFEMLRRNTQVMFEQIFFLAWKLEMLDEDFKNYTWHAFEIQHDNTYSSVMFEASWDAWIKHMGNVFGFLHTKDDITGWAGNNR